MAVWWIKAKLADKEVGGRSYAERRSALVQAIREHSRSFADIQPEEGLATFFVFQPEHMPKLTQAIKAAVAPNDDFVYGGYLKLSDSQRYGAVMPEVAREMLFDDMWRR